MCRKNKQRRNGFTLVELMLAIGFVGSLLVLIALIIIQIMGLYNKGLTLKEVNEVSRVVVRDMQQTIASSDAFTLTYDAHGTATVPQTLQDSIDSGEDVDYYSSEAGGRLCTGVYTYIWNTGKALKALSPAFGGRADTQSLRTDDGKELPIQFTKRADGTDVPVRFIKIRDVAKAYCRAPIVASGTPTTQDIKRHAQFVSATTESSDIANVFGEGNNNLVLYGFDISDNSVASTVSQGSTLSAASKFYHVQLVVGTQNGDENDDDGFIAASGGDCKPPAEAQMNEAEYCAVNKIEFVARTGRIGA